MFYEPTANAALAGAHISTGERDQRLVTRQGKVTRFLTDSALQSFREPLYLTDHALQLPDMRSNEQRRFPELFPHLTLTSS